MSHFVEKVKGFFRTIGPQCHTLNQPNKISARNVAAIRTVKFLPSLNL